MPPAQRDLAMRSIQIARQGLSITVSSPSYREGMKYAVHYTHATATFTASFLLRLARLFPDECDMQEIRNQVERLANLMSEIPGKRYALTLQLMLKRAKKRKAAAVNRSPKIQRENHRPMPVVMEQSPGMPVHHHPRVAEPFSPTYDAAFTGPEAQMHAAHMVIPMANRTTDAEHIWRGFEMTSNEQLPVWLSDQSLGGNSFSQNGMDAFLLPNDYLPPAPQIW
jgi:hypothetical protein